MSVWLGSNLHVIVSSPELAKEVLKENDQQLADRNMSRSSARFTRDGNDLVWANYGPHYVKVRKVCTIELFTPKRLEALKPIREDEVTSMVQSIFKDITNPGTYASLGPFQFSFYWRINTIPCHFLLAYDFLSHAIPYVFLSSSLKKKNIIIFCCLFIRLHILW